MRHRIGLVFDKARILKESISHSICISPEEFSLSLSSPELWLFANPSDGFIAPDIRSRLHAEIS